MSIPRLKGKKIAIVGGGVNNAHLAAYLKTRGLDFTIIRDWKSEDELVGQLDQYEVIFRTPGLPYLSQAIQQAKEKGSEISSQTKLFFKICPAPIIGITGTKGKGTTSSLIAHILKTAGRKVWLGGNIGRDPFEFIDQVEHDHLVVLELSSFQLQDMDQSPHVAVVLSITPDHLNYHHDFEEYIKAKSTIIAFQGLDDFAILDSSLPDWFKELGEGKKIINDRYIARPYHSHLIGNHNLENISAAVSVARLYDISDDVIAKAIAEFKPLEHRLQIVGEKNGITFVDDSISTNEESTVAAIKSFRQPVIAILGGSSKGVEYKLLGSMIDELKNLKAVIVVGEVADQILESIKGFQGQILTGAKNMSEIFDQVKEVAVAGDVVLLSPAAASFDMYKDYKDRANQFIREMNQL